MLAHLPRLLQLWRLAATYRLDTELDLPGLPPAAQQLGRLVRLHPAAWFSNQRNNPLRLKLALEAMGPLFIKLGQLLSTRQDLVPPQILHALVQLQDNVTPFDHTVARQRIEAALKQPVDQLFSRFDDTPLAAASIAQVYTAQLHSGEEVIVKVTRPGLRAQVDTDFNLLEQMAIYLEERIEAARALHLVKIVHDYRQTMLNELDLTLEAANATRMRKNFRGSEWLYVPKVYQSVPDVLVAERIYGLPVSDIAAFDAAGIDRAYLGELGLRIFFTQVLRDNFFHADMHPGNVFVDISNPAKPRFIALDCAIIGQLSDADRMTVARLLLAVMQNNFNQLVTIAHQAGWIPPGTDQFALSREMQRAVGPMISKPMNELDFAAVLLEIMDIARRFRLEIPPQLTLLLKTLVHVEGLGRELYPQLDIWQLTKPILATWLKDQMSPGKALEAAKEQLPGFLMNATDLPALITDSLHGLRQQVFMQDRQWRELQDLKFRQTREQHYNWLAGVPIAILLSLVWGAHGWLAWLAYTLVGLIGLWRVTR